MRLEHALFKQAQDAFSDAFDIKTLHIMVRTELGEDPESIMNHGSKKVQIYELLRWAEKADRVEDLVTKALEVNPTNRMLQELWVSITNVGLDDTLNPAREHFSNGGKIDLDDIAKLAYEYFGERYGISYPKMDITWTIHPDGSADIRRRITLKSYTNFRHLQTFVSTPDTKTKGIGFQGVYSETEGVDIEVTKKIQRVARNVIELRINPILKPGSEFTYVMDESLDVGTYAVNLTSDELQERNNPNMEYSGWSIQRPTTTLNMRVIFPPELGKPRSPDYEVRSGEVIGLPETREELRERADIDPPKLQRKTGEQGTFYELIFQKSYPLPGLVYVMSWVPVPIDS